MFSGCKQGQQYGNFGAEVPMPHSNQCKCSPTTAWQPCSRLQCCLGHSCCYQKPWKWIRCVVLNSVTEKHACLSAASEKNKSDSSHTNLGTHLFHFESALGFSPNNITYSACTLLLASLFLWQSGWRQCKTSDSCDCIHHQGLVRLSKSKVLSWTKTVCILFHVVSAVGEHHVPISMSCCLLMNTVSRFMSQLPCHVSFWWTQCPSSCPSFRVLSPFDEHDVPVHVPVSMSCLLLMNTMSQFMSQFPCPVSFWWTWCPSSFPFGQSHHQQFCIFLHSYKFVHTCLGTCLAGAGIPVVENQVWTVR